MADQAEVIYNESRSLGRIVQDILRDFQEILRAELRLARAEMSEKARIAARSGVLLGGAAVCGLLAAGALVACVIAALALAMPVWAAALIAGVVLAIVAGAAFAMGRARLKTVKPVPEQTAQTIREDVEWVKNRTR
ncbi:MAG TPA: phage holin family protein [Bryobacteraceae bacterium]